MAYVIFHLFRSDTVSVIQQNENDEKKKQQNKKNSVWERDNVKRRIYRIIVEICIGTWNNREYTVSGVNVFPVHDMLSTSRHPLLTRSENETALSQPYTYNFLVYVHL